MLAEDGYHEKRLRELTRRDPAGDRRDPHHLCCGPGGYTRAHGLEPDFLTIGKPIGGEVPVGACGFTEDLGERIIEKTIWEAADVGGIGTLVNARFPWQRCATLGEVLTDDAFARMIALGERFEERRRRDDRRARAALVGHPARLPGSTCSRQPRRGLAPETPRRSTPALDALLHLYMLNRGVLMTPFHMMALMSPATAEAQVDRHSEAFAEAAARGSS